MRQRAVTEFVVAARCACGKYTGFDPSDGQLPLTQPVPAARVAIFLRATPWRCRSPRQFTPRSLRWSLLRFLIRAGVAENGPRHWSGCIAATYICYSGRRFPPISDPRRDSRMGLSPTRTARLEPRKIELLRCFWTRASGLEAGATREIRCKRTFADFRRFLDELAKAPSIGPTLCRHVRRRFGKAEISGACGCPRTAPDPHPDRNSPMRSRGLLHQ